MMTKFQFLYPPLSHLLSTTFQLHTESVENVDAFFLVTSELRFAQFPGNEEEIFARILGEIIFW